MISGNNFDVANKIYLRGKVLSRPTIKFDQYSNENILHFTLAVPRDKELYSKGYNLDKHNYFYCVLREHNHTLSGLRKIARGINKMSYIEIKGCLDNRLSKEIQTTVNYRALNCYVSTINVLSLNIVEDTRPAEEISEEQKILNRIKDQFGHDVDVVFEKDSFKKDYFGFDRSDSLPDY